MAITIKKAAHSSIRILMHMPAQLFTPPDHTCTLCARLAQFRKDNAIQHPDWHNAPVTPFGSLNAQVLVVGLAPGLRGANCTGRPFTGDYAGDLLYPSLKAFGLATGEYGARPDDGFTLQNCRVTNAVRCVPPQNKPIGAEQQNCRPYLAQEIAAMPNLKAILALGKIAHDNMLSTLGAKRSHYIFGHQNRHDLSFQGRPLILFDSYHCSRYNTNTGRLTEDMFHNVLRDIVAAL
jgi:uracil-DNA glycosylase family 4